MARTVTGGRRPSSDPLESLTGPVKVPAAEGFWETRPVLTWIRDVARARRVAPWALLGAVMARAVAGTGHSTVIPALVGSHASLNLAVGLVGPPGAGKGAVMAVARDIVPLPDTVAAVGIGSGEGLAHVFARRHRGNFERTAWAALVYVPEIDSLRGVALRQGSTIMAELRKGWSGEPLGFSYADPSKRLPIDEHSYRLALVAGIQPGRADVLLGDQAAGTPQRFLWLPAEDPDAPDDQPDEPRAKVIRLPREHRDHDGETALRELHVAEAIREEVDADRLARLRGEAGDLLGGHAMLARLKVAAALAIICDGPGKVTSEDWALAAQVMQVSDHTRQLVIEETRSALRSSNHARAEADADRAVVVEGRLEGVKIQRTVSKIVNRARKLSGEGQETVSRRELRDAVGRDRDYFEQAMENVLDSEILARHGRGYRLP